MARTSSSPSLPFLSRRLILAAGFLSLFVMGGYALYSQTSKTRKTAETIELIETLKSATQQSFQGRPTYGSGDLVPELLASGTLPEELAGKHGFDHPWGNPVELTGNDQSFNMSLRAIPSAACVEIGAAYEGGDPDFISLTVGGRRMEKIDAEAFASACGTDEKYDMVWEFF